jgi:hypothetical protein
MQAYGRIALSCAPIFFSVGSLQYFSVSEPIGKLIIMLFAMVNDLTSFAVIFVIAAFGFCIALFSIARNSFFFGDIEKSILTLFSASFNNYEAVFDNMADGEYHALLLVIEVAFIILASVVLLNLVVARMTATHQKIDEKSFQEWQLLRASTTKVIILEK